jgi:lia operon protein LiaG
MKIKNQLLALGLALFSITATAQYKVQVQNSKEGKLTLTEFSGDLPIEGYSGNEIIIESDLQKKTESNDRAKGLKPIYPGGTDNTGIGLSVEKNGNQVTIRCLLPITHSRGNYKIRVPDNFKLEVENECGKGGKVDIKNMKNEIEVKNCHDVTLKGITGPVVLSTISGDVDIVFTELNKDKSLSIASISGEIDITLPAKAPVDLEMNSMSGSMYTDFEIPTDDGKMKKVGGGAIKAALNGGGVNLKITSISGNIYLRKG